MYLLGDGEKGSKRAQTYLNSHVNSNYTELFLSFIFLEFTTIKYICLNSENTSKIASFNIKWLSVSQIYIAR